MFFSVFFLSQRLKFEPLSGLVGRISCFIYLFFPVILLFFLTLCILFGIGGGGLKFLLVRCRRVRITVFGVAL